MRKIHTKRKMTMRAKKIILEIDGVRHKMVRNKVKDPCRACSLNKFCTYDVGSPCIGENDHFILEK